MRKLVSFLSLCLLSAIMMGCQNELLAQQEKDVDSPVLLYRMVSFGEIEEDSFFTVSDEYTIQLFKEAISSAKKVSGMADVVDPQFQVEFGEKVYYLWIDQDRSSVMDSEDSNTLYMIKDNNADQIYDFLSATDLID
ncbi:hypothetical protein BBH88_12120 [Planococcus antarcticus DSM 14505]|uniref:YhfM-like domain-containing protein n=1 Tax=Planococcus antarcticus DSM 14505 TaxID=1185653 RepID=A0ABM6D613_9BACL|nr:hypothetical protein [Planococcus antarcticus]ANU10998.1 hypothetical protein BBH88_12120 [Planococcus antarcticus DSM 14505]